MIKFQKREWETRLDGQSCDSYNLLRIWKNDDGESTFLWLIIQRAGKVEAGISKEWKITLESVFENPDGGVDDGGLFTLRMNKRANFLFANKGGTAGIEAFSSLWG
jgi:hypothetical protein